MVAHEKLKVISNEERDSYYENGYVAVPGLVSKEEIKVLTSAIEALVDKSRAIKESDGTFDLEEGHCAENPRLRRIAFLDDLDPIFWEFARDSLVADLASDLFGENITFRECLINIKWANGGQEVKWHQDIPFYPHTNLSVAQFLVFLDDVGSDQGPMQVLPRSHKGPVYEHYDDQENWLGYIPENTLANIPLDTATEVTGPIGTVSAHHCATIHSSKPNTSSKGRPILILGYNAEDSRPYTAPAYPSSHHGQVVRGSHAKFSRHDAVNLRLPPDWSGGYTSIFTHQNKPEAQ